MTKLKKTKCDGKLRLISYISIKIDTDRLLFIVIALYH